MSLRADILRGASCMAGVLLTTFIGGCQNGDLGGDIGGTYDLRFDAVRSYWVADELIIVYERSYTPTEDAASFGDPVKNQVVRLELDSSRQELSTDGEILIDTSETDYPALTVERYVLAESYPDGLQQEPGFPALRRAVVEFDNLSRDAGKKLSGEFECTFVDDRMLWGTFDGDVAQP